MKPERRDTMIITPLSQEGIDPIPTEILIDSLQRHFPDATLAFKDRSQSATSMCLFDIGITPPHESHFSVTNLPSGIGFSLDGSNVQNAEAAVAIREAWETTSRIVALESGGSWFVDLVEGMTTETVLDGWRPIIELEA
jgi:hypothetical protein